MSQIKARPSVIESNKIEDVLVHADEKTLVLFDVDNTLIEPVEDVGNTAWFKYVFKKFLARGLTEEQAGMKIYALWTKLSDFYNYKLVEEKTSAVVKQLQEKKIKTMGLTARGFDIAAATTKHLASVDISFHPSPIHNQEVSLDKFVGFSKGTLFSWVVGGKGASLLKFFERIKFEPEKILFIDDDPRYLDEVQRALGAKNIPFKGIRYGGADLQHERFNPARAEEEIRTFFAGTENMALVEEILS